MKEFVRGNALFSLCGLNCGLRSMNLGGHCSGCGFGDEACNKSCRVTKCSREHGNIEYCFQCKEYPCSKYENVDKFDSFITHKNQFSDSLKAARLGIDSYNAEQAEKVELLHKLLDNYNAGREKTLFCLAVNLLEISDIRDVIEKAEADAGVSESPLKEKAAFVAGQLREIAEQKNIELKLRRK